MHPYTAPALGLDAFNCPHCHAYAQQERSSMFAHRTIRGSVDGKQYYQQFEGYFITICIRCNTPAYWHEEVLVYPFIVTAPEPNPDLPDDIKKDFEEARQIEKLSPRGASALLRLAIQKLCRHLGESGTNINNDISQLVKKGLPSLIQKSLDIVRVIGNNAVHPGVIDFNDGPDTVNRLFSLVNLIAEHMITNPKSVNDFYNSLPEDNRQAIEKRDQPKT